MVPLTTIQSSTVLKTNKLRKESYKKLLFLVITLSVGREKTLIRRLISTTLSNTNNNTKRIRQLLSDPFALKLQLLKIMQSMKKLISLLED